jgi:hypothetical protein
MDWSFCDNLGLFEGRLMGYFSFDLPQKIQLSKVRFWVAVFSGRRGAMYENEFFRS